MKLFRKIRRQGIEPRRKVSRVLTRTLRGGRCCGLKGGQIAQAVNILTGGSQGAPLTGGFDKVLPYTTNFSAGSSKRHKKHGSHKRNKNLKSNPNFGQPF
jgi:hypothetical protein